MEQRLPQAGAPIPKVLVDLLEFLSVLFSDVSYQVNEQEYYLEIPRKDGEVLLWIALDAEELSLGFADWHNHYTIADGDASLISAFYADLNALLSNRAGVACAFANNEGHWCGSMLIQAENVNEEFLREEFGDNKVVRCSFWDAQNDRCYAL